MGFNKNSILITMEEVDKINHALDKIFGDSKIRFFQSSDALSGIAGDTYISYRYHAGRKDSIIISIGGSEIEETPVRVCTSAEQINKLVTAIIY